MRLVLKTLCTFALILSIGQVQLMAQDNLEEGEELFKITCKACHHLDMRLIGPPLRGVAERREEPWLLSFIKSSTTMIQSGDEVAVQLFNTYNKVPMPDQPLTDRQIRNILAYTSQPKAGSDQPFARPEVVISNAKPLSFTDFRFWIIYTIAVAMVVLAVYYKAEVATLQQTVASKKKEEEA